MLPVPELLSPAGDLEKLQYAFRFGADAVYCALPEFGMRSAPQNFTVEQLAEGYRTARALAVRLIAQFDTLAREGSRAEPALAFNFESKLPVIG